MEKDNVILLRDASKAWVSVAELPSRENEIFILTPYVTGSIIKEIVTASGTKTVHLITSLNAQSVIAKSLDLELIRELLAKQVKVYSHDKLHAKILINGDQAIIGSQNFTTGGKFNKEASVHLKLTASNQDNLAKIINDVIEGSTYLTLKEIDKFQHLCKKYFDELNELNIKLNQINSSITQNEILTDHQGLNKDQQIFLQNPAPTIHASVRLRSWKSANIESALYTAIVSSKDQPPILDSFEEVGHPLEKGTVIPIYDVDNSSLFYGELHQTQISKIYDVGLNHKLRLGFPAPFMFVPPNESPNRSNVSFPVVVDDNLEAEEKLAETIKDEALLYRTLLSRHSNHYFFRFSLSGSCYETVELLPGETLDHELIEAIKHHGEEAVLTAPRSTSSDARYMIRRRLLVDTKLDLKPWVHERGLPMLLVKQR